MLASLYLDDVKKAFVILIAVLCSSAGISQAGRQFTPLYNLSSSQYLNKGWHLAPGMTYMFPASINRSETRLTTTDSLYSGDFTAAGKLGLYVEFGRHKFTDVLLVMDYFDYGLGFKGLRGTEEFMGRVLVDSLGTTVDAENKGFFSEGFVTGFFNASKITQVGDNSFIQNSLGLNADYRVYKKHEFEGNADHFLQSFPGNFQFQLHYKLGFGYHLDKNLYVIPSIETPILTFYEFDDGKSTFQYFSSRYRPVIFTLRFLWFDKRPNRDCVGAPSEKTGHQLWDKKMSRKYRRR